MATMLITVESAELDIAAMRQRFDKSHNRRRMLQQILNYLQAAKGGFKPAYLNVALCSAHASATITCTQASAVDATDTVVIAGTTLALVAVPATESQFAKGATNATMATNLAAKINAHSVLSKLVRATVLSNVVTLTCKVPGPIGNLVTLTETGNGMAVTGGGALASGASDEMDALQFGYDPTV